MGSNHFRAVHNLMDKGRWCIRGKWELEGRRLFGDSMMFRMYIFLITNGDVFVKKQQKTAIITIVEFYIIN